MVCPCCVRCKILKDGVYVDWYEIDWLVALDVSCFGRSIYPGYQYNELNGEVLINVETQQWSSLYTKQEQDPFPNLSYWPFIDIKNFSCNNILVPQDAVFVGGFGQMQYSDNDGSQWFIQVNIADKNFLLDIHFKENANECILYGHVNTQTQSYKKALSYTIPQEDLHLQVTETQSWRWQSTIFNGVFGDVTITPVSAVRQTYTGYDDSGNLITNYDYSGPFGATPVVTITIAP